jgi:lipopolysaccharide biosynthesis regulator YciM
MFDSLLAWLLLPLGAVLGWALAQRMPKPEQQSLSTEQLGGLLSHLAGDDPDQAIAALTQAAEIDQSTAELHLTLGNLFRKRGEVDRAMRIHEALLSRPTLKPQIQHQVRFELAQDYFKAGLMDRAENTFRELAAQGLFVTAALEQLVAVYEQGRDWRQALDTARQLEAAKGESKRAIIAQYYCELAEEARRAKISAEAFKLARKSLDTDKDCVRASLLLGTLHEADGDFADAAKCYRRAFDQDVRFLSEVMTPLQRCSEKTGDVESFVTFLDDAKSMTSSSLPLVAEAKLMRQEGMDAMSHLSSGLEAKPTRAVLVEFLDVLEKRPEVIASGLDKPAASLRQALLKLMESSPHYQCSNCGFVPRQLFWQCPSCKHWGQITPVDDALKPKN